MERDYSNRWRKKRYWKKCLVMLLAASLCVQGNDGMFGTAAYASAAQMQEADETTASSSVRSVDAASKRKKGDNTYTDTESGIVYTYTVDEEGNGTISSVDVSEATTTEVEIPGVMDEVTITEIGEIAFRGCNSLTSITIPEGVTSIGDSAFLACLYLKDITIPEGVVKIGNSAFQNCSLSYNVTLPESLEVIGDSVFSWTGISRIKIPAGVTSIGTRIFAGCTSLDYVEVSSENTVYDSRNGCEGIIETETDTLIAGCHKTTIPSGVKTIGDSAFYYCISLTEITIPESVENISDNAFYYCFRLESITIPENVDRIGDSAFYYCYGLTTVIIPSSVTSIGEYAFYQCYSLKSITIPSGVTSIGEYVFYYCTSLESVTIPSGVTSIGEDAFYHCTSLESITIPSGVASISREAFSDCSSLKSVTISSGVTRIGEYAFYYCTSLESITIPSSVTSISDCVFCKCSSLKEINVSSENSVYDSRNGCNAIIATKSNTLIAGCMNTIIPADVTSIEGNAFSGCRSLESITIPSGVTSIGGYAFSSCSSLESITIPSSVTSIGNGAFSGCRSLESITIPSGVTSIGGYAFSSCSLLESITIPSSVTSIGEYAFAGCSSLESITIPLSVTSIDKTAFSISTESSYWDNAKKSFILYTTKGSYADSWVEKYSELYDIEVVYISEETETSRSTDEPSYSTTYPAIDITEPYDTMLPEPTVKPTAIPVTKAPVTAAPTVTPTDNIIAMPSDTVVTSSPQSTVSPWLPVISSAPSFETSEPVATTQTTSKPTTSTAPGSSSTSSPSTTTTARPTTVTTTKPTVLTTAKPSTTRQDQTITASSVKKTYSKKTFYLNATTSGDGTLSYTSSNTKIAVVSSTGQVSLKGYGVAKITITAAQTDKYNEAQKTITVTVIPGQVKIKKASSPRKGLIRFSWKKMNGVDGYQYTVVGSGVSVKQSCQKTTVQGGGRSGKKFVVRVRAYKKVGSKKYYGAWSKAKTIKVR